MKRLILCAALAAGIAGQAAAANLVKSYSYFRVGGSTLDEIEDQLARHGPKVNSTGLRHPELLDSLVRADLVRLVRTRDELASELFERLAAAGDDFESELDVLRRFRHEEFLRIGVHDIQGQLDAEGVSSQLSLLADVCLSAAIAIAPRDVGRKLGLSPQVPTENLVVLAMGKLGGEELAYHSDLDLIFVYDPGDPAKWPNAAASAGDYTVAPLEARS